MVDTEAEGWWLRQRGKWPRSSVMAIKEREGEGERKDGGGGGLWHCTLMRGRQPKKPGNKIRCNSIQLLLSCHG